MSLRGRKVAFSAKQKKVQLQMKRERKRVNSDSNQDVNQDFDESKIVTQVGQSFVIGGDTNVDIVNRALARNSVVNINQQPTNSRSFATTSGASNRDVNRYALQFFAESEHELKARREEGRRTITFLSSNQLEVSPDVCELDFPKRPPLNNRMSPKELEQRENHYFRTFCSQRIEAEKMSYFELNLETWRQLWRVLEMADIVLLIADIRHPLFHFPPALYRYVVEELGKSMILVLNKIDLVEAPLVVAWKEFLKKLYPQLHIITFASYAGMKVKSSGSKTKTKKRIGNLKMAAKGAKGLLSACQDIVRDQVDLTSWRDKIEEELHEEEEKESTACPDQDEEHQLIIDCEQKLDKLDLSYYEGERYKDGVLTIGCVGHPNVGKSSLLNAIMGKKVVSVSRTPGHTKHFQTIFLTPNVKLCDCPGLVFPSRSPKSLQVLMGCFPIAQLREPFSVVKYLAERFNLIKLLNLQHPSQDTEWSAYDICEAWAIKRSFFTARAARPDVHRAANHLLRMTLDGRTICLAFYPLGFIKDKLKWEKHEDIKLIESVQGGKPIDDEEDDFDGHLDGNLDDKRLSQDDESDEEQSSEEEMKKKNFASFNKFSALEDQ